MDEQTDGRTDRRTDGQVENIILVEAQNVFLAATIFLQHFTGDLCEKKEYSTDTPLVSELIGRQQSSLTRN